MKKIRRNDVDDRRQSWRTCALSKYIKQMGFSSTLKSITIFYWNVFREKEQPKRFLSVFLLLAKVTISNRIKKGYLICRFEVFQLCVCLSFCSFFLSLSLCWFINLLFSLCRHFYVDMLKHNLNWCCWDCCVCTMETFFVCVFPLRCVCIQLFLTQLSITQNDKYAQHTHSGSDTIHCQCVNF